MLSSLRPNFCYLIKWSIFTNQYIFFVLVSYLVIMIEMTIFCSGEDISIVTALESEAYQQAQIWFSSLPIFHQTRIMAHFGPTPAREEDPLVRQKLLKYMLYLLQLIKKIELKFLKVSFTLFESRYMYALTCSRRAYYIFSGPPCGIIFSENSDFIL